MQEKRSNLCCFCVCCGRGRVVEAGAGERERGAMTGRSPLPSHPRLQPLRYSAIHPAMRPGHLISSMGAGRHLSQLRGCIKPRVGRG